MPKRELSLATKIKIIFWKLARPLLRKHKPANNIKMKKFGLILALLLILQLISSANAQCATGYSDNEEGIEHGGPLRGNCFYCAKGYTWDPTGAIPPKGEAQDECKYCIKGYEKQGEKCVQSKKPKHDEV